MPSIAPLTTGDRSLFLDNGADAFEHRLSATGHDARLAQADAASPAEGLAHAARAAAAWVLSGKAFADGAKAASDLKDAVVANYPTARDWTVAQWKAFNSFYADAVMRSGGSGLALNTSVDTARVTPQDARTLRALVDGAVDRVAGRRLGTDDLLAAADRRTVSGGEGAVPESYGLNVADLARRLGAEVVVAYTNGADPGIRAGVESLTRSLNAAGIRTMTSALLSPRLAEAARDKLLVIVNHGSDLSLHGLGVCDSAGNLRVIEDRKTGERRALWYTPEQIADTLTRHGVEPRAMVAVACSPVGRANELGRVLANEVGVPVVTFQGVVATTRGGEVVAPANPVLVELWGPGQDEPSIQLRLRPPPGSDASP